MDIRWDQSPLLKGRHRQSQERRRDVGATSCVPYTALGTDEPWKWGQTGFDFALYRGCFDSPVKDDGLEK